MRHRAAEVLVSTKATFKGVPRGATLRSVMSRELVDFFEREVPTIVTAGLGLVGGIAMLLLYDRICGPDRRAAAGPGADRTPPWRAARTA
jgi:hypothetical protein